MNDTMDELRRKLSEIETAVHEGEDALDLLPQELRAQAQAALAALIIQRDSFKNELTARDIYAQKVVVGVNVEIHKPPDPAEMEKPHLRAYLWRWFSQPWAKVPLAEYTGPEHSQSVSLLDIYVPLPVDFNITVKLEKLKITDWWASDVDATRQSKDGHKDGEISKRHEWPSLGVGETSLQTIVEGIGKKLDARSEDDWSEAEAQDGALSPIQG